MKHWLRSHMGDWVNLNQVTSIKVIGMDSIQSAWKISAYFEENIWSTLDLADNFKTKDEAQKYLDKMIDKHGVEIQ